MRTWKERRNHNLQPWIEKFRDSLMQFDNNRRKALKKHYNESKSR